MTGRTDTVAAVSPAADPGGRALAGVLVVQWEKDSMYGLTLVWALTAVYGEQSAPLVTVSALICIGVLLVVVLLRCSTTYQEALKP